MAKQFTSLALALTTLIGVTFAVPAGAAAGMDLLLIKNIKNYVMPAIIRDINSLQLGRINYDGGYVENIKFNFGVASQDSVDFAFDPVANAIVFKCIDISGGISGNFRQKLLLISAKGNFKAQFQYGGAAMKVSFPIHTQMVNGRKIPKIDVQNFNLNFDPNKIKISIGGGILADIGNLFVQIFKRTIIHSIGDGINNNVPKTLQSLIQSYLIAQNGILPLYKGLAFDYQLPQDPVFTSDTAGLYLNGTFFNQTKGYKVPKEAVNNISLNFTSKDQILIDTSRYTVDSLLLSFYDQNVFNISIDQKVLGPTLGQEYLNTTYLERILPGLIQRYGENQAVSVSLATIQSPMSTFEVGKMGLDLTGVLSIFVNNQLAAKIEVDSIQVAVSVTLINFLLTVQFEPFLYITDAKLLYTDFGPINTSAIRNFVNFVAYLARPVINTYLSPGFMLPQEYFGIVRVRNAMFLSLDGFCQVGIVPEFI